MYEGWVHMKGGRMRVGNLFAGWVYVTGENLRYVRFPYVRGGKFV